MVIFREFREFAMRGNAIDMAVGIVIGTSFGRIVSSIVADIIMPPLGILIGGIDFSDLSITLKEAVGDSAAVTVNYGSFIKTVVDFVIIALVIFLVVHVMNAIRKKEEPLPAPPPQPSAEEKLLVEIRDLLKQR